MVAYNYGHEQWEENEKYMIYELYSFIERSKFKIEIKSKQTKPIISAANPEDQKAYQYFFVCENDLAEKIKSISKYENFYELYLYLFVSSLLRGKYIYG
jgi:hypothetical protein